METEKLRERIKQHWAEGMSDAQIEWKYDDRRVMPLIAEMIASGELEPWRFWRYDWLDGLTAWEVHILTEIPLKACLAEGFPNMAREQLDITELRRYVETYEASEIPKPVMVQIKLAWGSYKEACWDVKDSRLAKDDPWMRRGKFF
jgi:hypothetical protein